MASCLDQAPPCPLPWAGGGTCLSQGGSRKPRIAATMVSCGAD
jgi:hypothetical protein